jgi:hypothetical protein
VAVKFRAYKNTDLTVSEIVSFVAALGACLSEPKPSSHFQSRLERSQTTDAAERSSFLGDQLTTCWQPWLQQRSCRSAYHRAENPAWIELEIAVGRTGRDRRDNFELLNREARA